MQGIQNIYIVASGEFSTYVNAACGATPKLLSNTLRCGGVNFSPYTTTAYNARVNPQVLYLATTTRLLLGALFRNIFNCILWSL